MQKPEEKAIILPIRLKENWKDFQMDDELHVVWVPEENTWWLCKDKYSTYTLTRDEILEFADFVGPEDHAAYKAGLTEKLALPGAPNIQENLQIEAPGENIEESNPESCEVTITQASQIGKARNIFLSAKKELDTIKSLVLQRKAVLQQHAAAYGGLLEAQSRALMAQMAEMQNRMADLEDAIQMINLYLGSTETVVPIRAGKKAPAETPIHIRQRLLYMDEECALLNEAGIDYKKLSEFDRFVQNEALLTQILPEEKGVVVLQVMREPKKYSGVDIITQMVLDQENAKTYWLVRNGDCLWRFWSDLATPEKIFPDQKDAPMEVSNHRPGEKEYYREMKSAEGTRRTYMKVGLLLQGLIDRTNIFAPFPDKIRPQLTNPKSWEGRLTFLEDAAPSLGEGRPSFPEWLKEINGHLEEGQRVIIHTLETDAIHPKYCTGWENQILQVTKSKEGFRASFQRTDEIWTRHSGYKAARGYGSVRLNPRNEHFINFDRAREEDFSFYLRSRETRISYKRMVPLLRQCEALKKEERIQEEPFITLLIREAQSQNATENVEEKIRGLVRWWKQKNKNHRALVTKPGQNPTEDQEIRAFKEILAEFRKQVEGEKSGDNPPVPAGCILAVRTQPKEVLFFFPEEGCPPHCKKEIWTLRKSGWKKKEEMTRCLVGKNTKHHGVFHSDSSWLDLEKKCDRARIHTNDLKPNGALAKAIWDSHDPEKGLPVALILEESCRNGATQSVGLACFTKTLHLYPTRTNGKYQNGQPPKIEIWYKWNSTATNEIESWLNKTGLEIGSTLEASRWGGEKTILMLDKKNLQKFQAFATEETQKRENKRRARSYTCHAESVWNSALRTQWETQEKTKFLSEGGDPQFFEDHLRTVLSPKFEETPLTRALEILLELNQMALSEVVGKTWGEIKDRANKMPKSKKSENRSISDNPYPWDEEDQNCPGPEGFKMPEEEKNEN